MKPLLSTLSLILILVFASNCKNSTSSIEETINGSWNLKTMTGGFMGLNNNFQDGEVVWTFDEGANTLVIEVNILSTIPTETYYGLGSGNYSYEIQQESGIMTLYADDSKVGIISFSDKELILDDGIVADGFMYEFTN